VNGFAAPTESRVSVSQTLSQSRVEASHTFIQMRRESAWQPEFKRDTMTTTLIIPGLHSSGPGHWQTWFEEQLPGTVRVIQSDWDKADLATWSARVRRDIHRNPSRHIVVAHSFGVLAAVHAASREPDRIAGALLVGPADPERFNATRDLPRDPLPFPAVVVASSNDPWMTLWKAAEWADRWETDFVNLGEAGHINAESGFGPWPEGLSLLERLRRRSQHVSGQRSERTGAFRRPPSWKRDTDGTAGLKLRHPFWTASRLGAG
jgi:predicted alpha/beta hydrolase family esterase